MKRLLALSLLGSYLLTGSNPAKADWDFWAFKDATIVDPHPLGEGYAPNVYNMWDLYKVNSANGDEVFLKRFCKSNSNNCEDVKGFPLIRNQENFNDKTYHIDNNSIVIEEGDSGSPKKYKYTVSGDTITKSEELSSLWQENYSAYEERKILSIDNNGIISADYGNTQINQEGISIGNNSLIKQNTNGEIQIGADGNDIDITAEGLNIDGNPLITKKDNGEIHIGKNSLITKSEEETLSDGRKVQPLYAKDADGNKIPINIDGSKLLIDGVEVIAGGNNTQVTTNKNNISTNSSNIKNLGKGVAGSTALTAALTALPQTSKESKLSCGIGTGAYSSRYAVGFGCASKVNERVDINAGGSYVFGGSKSYGEGTLDSGVVKAGFVFKLGELNKPTQISRKNKKVMETKIETLEEKNKQLLARLERLEKIALGESKSQDLAVYPLK